MSDIVIKQINEQTTSPRPIYPLTSTKAVYDTNGEVLENILIGINASLLKCAFKTIEVKPTSGPSNNYGGYYVSSNIPSLESLGIEGALIGTPILASYGYTVDANVECLVRLNASRKMVFASSPLAGRTVSITFVYLYI